MCCLRYLGGVALRFSLGRRDLQGPVALWLRLGTVENPQQGQGEGNACTYQGEYSS